MATLIVDAKVGKGSGRGQGFDDMRDRRKGSVSQCSTTSPALSPLASASETSCLTSADRFYTPDCIASTVASSPAESRRVSIATNEGAKSSSALADGKEPDPRDTDLNCFHDAAKLDDDISGSEFTKIKGISDACGAAGTVELHQWQVNGTERTVVVKRVDCKRAFANRGSKTANERLLMDTEKQMELEKRSVEDTLNEIGIYRELAKGGALMPEYLLKIHGAFVSSNDVWLVLDFAEEGDLLSAVQGRSSPVPTSQLLRWSWEMLRAVQYMHWCGIGHRDISLENLLLHHGSVRLMDFGQGVKTCTATESGSLTLRYFGTVGKPYYRSPECRIPKQQTVQVIAPWGAKPGSVVFAASACGNHLCEVRLPLTAIPGQPCAAEPWGYTAALADVFAIGVCIFVVATGSPPWREAILGDPHFKWVHRQGIPKLLKAWKRTLPEDFLALLEKMLASDPALRPSAASCLEHTCFGSLAVASPPQQKALDAATATSSTMSPESFADPYTESCFLGADDLCDDSITRGCVACDGQDALYYSGMAGDFYSKEEGHRGVAISKVELRDGDCGLVGGTVDVCSKTVASADSTRMPPPPLDISILRGEPHAKTKAELSARRRTDPLPDLSLSKARPSGAAALWLREFKQH